MAQAKQGSRGERGCFGCFWIRINSTLTQYLIYNINSKKTAMSNHNPTASWKPGQSGNPNGRPKKDMSLTELMREYLTEIPEGQQKTRKEEFTKKVFERALAGDVAHTKLVFNYVEGMPKQTFEGTIGPKEFYDQLINSRTTPDNGRSAPETTGDETTSQATSSSTESGEVSDSNNGS